MIQITDRIAIDEREIEETFVRASGPGVQNVNKVSSAVRLRFDVRRSPNLPHGVKERLERLAGSRMTGEGVLIINAQRHRTQERNRVDALERLVALLREAAIPPVPRRETKVPRGERRRRIEGKRRRSAVKKLRGGVGDEA
jgi:ribosome-associated protein